MGNRAGRRKDRTEPLASPGIAHRGAAVITPAISILSAVEGLKLLGQQPEAYIIPATLVIIAGLFAIQRFGTRVVGTLFGPVMLVWFVTIAVIGINQIARNPQVIAAIDPA